MYSMELKINWDYKRENHAIERMWLRGVSTNDIINAVQRGKKRKQKDSLIESFYSYYSVQYAEYVYEKEGIHKIYPITVKLW